MDRNTKDTITFSFDTISDFDNHISNSITGYDLLHTLIINLSHFFVKPYHNVIDLGCTSGKLIHRIQEDNPKSKCYGYDITDHNFIPGPAELKQVDIRTESLPESILITSVFTLQFLKLNDRLPLLKEIYRSLVTGGVFIFCEKEYAENSVIQEAFTFTNYDNKRKYFTAEEILNKEVKLREIMHCLKSRDNISLLQKAGFKTIDVFFQSMNFKGYICTK